MNFSHLAGVYFDCWDTLISFHLKNHAWNYQTLKDHCLNQAEIDWNQVSIFCEDFYQNYYHAHLEYELKVEQILNLMVHYFGMKLDCSLLQCEHEILIHLDPKPLAGIEKMFAYLEQENIPYYVLSNTVYPKEDTLALITQLIPCHHLSYLLASYEIGVKKPNPLFFQCGVIHTGKNISDCLYVGDKFLQDVYGSYKAGFGLSVWMNAKQKNLDELNQKEPFGFDPHQIPYCEVSSYEELIAYLKDKRSE